MEYSALNIGRDKGGRYTHYGRKGIRVSTVVRGAQTTNFL